MRIARLLIHLIIAAALIWFLDGIRTKAVPLAGGRFLDPFHGFWQNMEHDQPKWPTKIDIPGLKDKVTIHYDNRRVPHIFAQNDHDLYLAQGFVTARDRLWQMEFQTHAAAGRLSEIIDDERVVRMDRFRRRTGMVTAAETALKAVEANPQYLDIYNAYTAGVNAYIQSLEFKRLPIEYKLLDYRPEPWTNLKTSLLLKFMAWDLTGASDDFEQLNFQQAFGSQEYATLFAPLNDSVHPIVPRGTPFPFAAGPIKAPTSYSPDSIVPKLSYPQPSKELGSNNWVVSGKKTASGKPILCNDPHLSLRLPSLWYEIQLATPEHNVYGVSLPGAPCVIIGFNEHIAWGVTNASRDVIDWYHIKFADARRDAYAHGGTLKPTHKRIEQINIRNKQPLFDTVVYTHHGPVVFDHAFTDPDSLGPYDVALRWAAADSSLEIRTLYLMNRAKSHSDYKDALKTFFCPGQNFIFASKTGDIAITQNGRFPQKWPGQGEFVMDGSNPLHDWQAYIPMEHNPHALNPKQGFLFSSNQAAADPTYPYVIPGFYDYTRNRRIHSALSAMKGVTVLDMQRLLYDNQNIRAAEFLPIMLAKLDSFPAGDSLLADQSPEDWKNAIDTLAAWNFMCEPHLTAPSLFEFWEQRFIEAIWADESRAAGKYLDRPGPYLTMHHALRTDSFPYIDDKETGPVETLKQILTRSFAQALRAFRDYEYNESSPAIWQNVNNVRVVHLSRQEAFSHYQIATGGNAGVVNATRQNNGASWRMVVELGDRPNAYGVYPGGQSGNPGSSMYDNGIPVWAKGEMFPLHFLRPGETPKDIIMFTQTLEGKAQ